MPQAWLWEAGMKSKKPSQAVWERQELFRRLDFLLFLLLALNPTYNQINW